MEHLSPIDFDWLCCFTALTAIIVTVIGTAAGQDISIGLTAGSYAFGQGRPHGPKCYECQKFRHKAVKCPNRQQGDDNSRNHSSNSQSG